MRILHTSDWHLGQSFFTKSRKQEHQAFIRWLLEQVKQQKIDAVIIAGDVFDSGTPPSYARELYNRFVVELSQLDCTLIVLGGNHDSVSMLNESKPLVECLNTHVIASTNDDLDSQVIELEVQGETQALLCAVPFVRARDVMQSISGSSGTEKQKQLGDAIKAHYFALYNRALQIKQQRKLAVPIITTGHLTAMGVTKTDSERDIYIGTLDAFAADGFPPADYIALGHIHRPQVVAKSEHIRYCGSPIPLSFDELKSTKQVVVVEFEQEQRKAIEVVEVPRFQQMACIKGDLTSIESQLEAFPNADSGNGDATPVWLAIEVETDDFLSDLQQRVQALVEGLNVEVLQLRRAKKPRMTALKQEKQETLSELTPMDVFNRRVEMTMVDSDSQHDQERITRIRTQFKQILETMESEEQQ